MAVLSLKLTSINSITMNLSRLSSTERKFLATPRLRSATVLMSGTATMAQIFDHMNISGDTKFMEQVINGDSEANFVKSVK